MEESKKILIVKDENIAAVDIEQLLRKQHADGYSSIRGIGAKNKEHPG